MLFLMLCVLYMPVASFDDTNNNSCTSNANCRLGEQCKTTKFGERQCQPTNNNHAQVDNDPNSANNDYKRGR